MNSQHKVFKTIQEGREALPCADIAGSGLRNDHGSGSAKYLGSPQNLLLKFQYNYGRLLQFGWLAEKDAGEQWMFAKGLDFFSFHFFARDLGPIKKLALGDFQVNMGQGLIQWQGMSIKKSANVLFVKKQEEVIRPYRSAGEINFHRGLGRFSGQEQLGMDCVCFHPETECKPFIIIHWVKPPLLPFLKFRVSQNSE